MTEMSHNSWERKRTALIAFATFFFFDFQLFLLQHAANWTNNVLIFVLIQKITPTTTAMKQEDEGKFTEIQYRCGWNCLVSVKMNLQLLYTQKKTNKKNYLQSKICNECFNYPIHFIL